MSDLDSVLARRRLSLTAKLSPAKPKALLDDAGGEDDSAAADYTGSDLRLRTVAAIQQWMETEDGDLDTGETYADRLLALCIGIADENANGELDEDEQSILDACLENAWDYLSSKGVTEDDCDALLNEGDNDAAARVIELLRNTIPDGAAADEDLDNFAFAPTEALMDAVYKKKVAIRGGKKVRINKRVSGTVRLTAKQKMALVKARRKSHSASAMMRRAKSVKVRARTIG